MEYTVEREACWRLARKRLTLRHNVLIVLADYNGHDETSVGPSGAENPRNFRRSTLRI